ncbi:hypothetical protein BH11CYA1_BH11CYA1_50900 [soil metagenome]
MKTNLVQRICKIATTIVFVSSSLTLPCFAQENASENFAEPRGKAIPYAKSTTPPTDLLLQLKPAVKGRPIIGLALGGGGMRGAAHIGVLKALVRAQIPIDLIAGTSMGAIVGGMYCAGIDVDSLAQKFADGSLMKSFMPLSLPLTLASVPVFAVPKTLDKSDYDGLYSGKKFRKYIDHTVPEYQRNIETLRVPFAAVALNLVDGKTYALTHGNLGVALQASSAVPSLREPVRIGNQLFVDGGVVDNIPVDVARAMGADIVIAVNVNERFDLVPPENFKQVGSVAKRIVTLQLASEAAKHLQAADFIIHPNVDGIGLTSIKIKDAKTAIDAGEKAAWEVVPSIKERLKQAELLTP